MGPEKMGAGWVMMLEGHFVIKSTLILEGFYSLLISLGWSTIL